MSRGFVREDDQEEPVFVPKRAPVPPGFDNLVTPRGLRLLQEELAGLVQARAAVETPEGAERRRALAEINGRIALLDERLASARLVEPEHPAPRQVRFGSTVTFRMQTGPQQGAERTFTLVGADEAKVAEGRIAFTAPVAQALMGLEAGSSIEFRAGDRMQTILVTGVR